ASCTDNTLVIFPVIDVPQNDPDALATGFDTIELSVAHAGNGNNLVSRLFSKGKTLQIPGVPFGADLVIHMSGRWSGTEEKEVIPYGRTCAVGVASNAAVPTPHLYFSRTSRFGNLDARPLVRINGLGIPYLGAALLVGGHDSGNGAVAQVERF